jgi:hypothetical protein
MQLWCSIFPNKSHRPRICLLSSTNLSESSIYTNTKTYYLNQNGGFTNLGFGNGCHTLLCQSILVGEEATRTTTSEGMAKGARPAPVSLPPPPDILPLLPLAKPAHLLPPWDPCRSPRSSATSHVRGSPLCVAAAPPPPVSIPAASTTVVTRLLCTVSCGAGAGKRLNEPANWGEREEQERSGDWGADYGCKPVRTPAIARWD